MTIRPYRSALYMPGSNARAIEKSRALPADAVIFDLEDAVAPANKETARAQVTAAVKAGGFGQRAVIIRINGLGTPWGKADLESAASAKPDAILVPKVESPVDLKWIGTKLDQASIPQSTAVWAMIETPLAIMNVASIAECAVAHPESRLACLILGTNDLVKETRAELDDNRSAAIYWLSATITAARAYGLTVLDGVYNNFKDLDGLARECRHGRMLGFDGKTLIHPDQILAANQIFAPSAADIAWARKIIAAFEQPEHQGKGAITLDGRMVELLHADIARDTVAIADAIAKAGT
jgi:citrate lyase subunit beta / citryl-CoA lyase